MKETLKGFNRKLQIDKFNKKMLIGNIATFIFLLLSFYVLHGYYQEFNFELQYREYNTDSSYFEDNISLNQSDIESMKSEYILWSSIPLGMGLILILNTMYYIFIYIGNNYRKNSVHEG